MTKHPELFGALVAPFAQHEVKSRRQANLTIHYVTARTVMNRLDDVLGPEGWWDDYVAGEDSVLCRLTIRLPDGGTLTKTDAGGYAGMADSGDDDKSGYSDAFKRAAVKFGVGRYLYKDGVPQFSQAHRPSPAANGKPAPAQTVAKFRQWRDEFVRNCNAKWIERWAPDGHPPPTLGELLNRWQLSRHLLKWAVAEELLAAPEAPTAAQVDAALAGLMPVYGASLVAEARRYAQSLWRTEAAKLKAQDPGPEDASQDLDPDADYADEPGMEG